MIIIAIEHCNGEIMEDPIIIKNWEEIKKYWSEGYLIYKIDWFNDSIERVEYD